MHFHDLQNNLTRTLGPFLSSKNPVMRKGASLAGRLPKVVFSLLASDNDFLDCPPVFVNSIPKSGTHLLMATLQQYQYFAYFGEMLAQTPSLTLRKRKDAEIAFRLSQIVPMELFAGHLHYSERVMKALSSRNIRTVFLYRDPREILLSEAYYLSKMNRFHKMHKEFRSLNAREALELAIRGNGTDCFPDFCKRITPYLGWLEQESILAVNYRDLKKIKSDTRLMAKIFSHLGLPSDSQEHFVSFYANTDPERLDSHTKSSRRESKQWDSFSKDAEELFRLYGGEKILERLEKSDN